VLHLLELAEHIGLKLNLWKTQTLFAQICAKHLFSLRERRTHEEAAAYQVALLRRLGERLGFYALDGVPLEMWDQT
jgi:hypothetical protein